MLNNKYNIRLVDGFKIRNTLDDDFAIFHQHSTHPGHYLPKYYIPHNEWWLDHCYQNETELLIKIEELLVPATIANYEAEREFRKTHLCLPGPVPEFKKSTEIREGVKIILVDGQIVRAYIDPEFVLGGHEVVYRYIPAGEIWLDGLMDKREVPYILHHEWVERELMLKGQSYDDAHGYATVADKELRRRDGYGNYPGDANYSFYHDLEQEIIKQYYVGQ